MIYLLFVYIKLFFFSLRKEKIIKKKYIVRMISNKIKHGARQLSYDVRTLVFYLYS